MLTFEKIKDEPSVMGYLGAIEDVIDGWVSESLQERRFLANGFQYGFQAGSPQSFLSLGEAIALNDTLYAARTDRIDVQNRLIWGGDFVTSAFFIIPHGCTCNYKVAQNSLVDSFEVLYEEILQEVVSPYVFVGTAIFSEVHVTAMTSPPIKKETIFESYETYFREPVQIQKNITAFVIGVVADFSNNNFLDINKKLRVALYRNPFDETKGPASHAHVLTIKQWVDHPSNIHPDDAFNIYHVFPVSRVEKIQLEIFKIGDVEDFSDKLPVVDLFRR